MSAPRLVATDLDGTLVRSDNTVSAYTQQVLAELDERDVPVVFVTGRPLRWAEDVFDHVGRHGLAVISNGALVWDVAGDRPVALRGIEPDVGLEVAELIRAAVPGSAFAIETLAGIVAGAAVPRASPRTPRQPPRADRRAPDRAGPQADGAARGAGLPGVLGPGGRRRRRPGRDHLVVHLGACWRSAPRA